MYYCPSGHICNMTRQPTKELGFLIDFKCYECNKKGKYEDGAYVCA